MTPRRLVPRVSVASSSTGRVALRLRFNRSSVLVPVEQALAVADALVDAAEKVRADEASTA